MGTDPLKSNELLRRCSICGHYKPLRSAYHKDRTKSLGYRRECKQCRSIRRQALRRSDLNYIALQLWANAKRRAKAQSLPFTIAPADVIQCFPYPLKCPALGVPLTLGVMPLTPSLDRMVPELGYVPGNIHVISHRANTLKSNGTAEEHRKIAEWMDRIAERKRKINDLRSRFNKPPLS